MEQLIFDNETLEGHSLYSKWHSTLQELSERDYGTKYHIKPKGIECLDLDTYEKSISGQADCTVDAVIGVCNDDNCRKTSHRLKCVELRMRYFTTSGFSATEFLRKIRHSHDLLGEDIPVDKTCIFVYDDKFIQRATSWFNRKKQEHPALKCIQPCSVTTFADLVKSEEDIPYQPEHDIAALKKTFEELLKKKDWESFMCRFYELCNETTIYQRKKPFEYEALHKFLHSLWTEFKAEFFPEMNATLQDFATGLVEQDFDYLILQ